MKKSKKELYQDELDSILQPQIILDLNTDLVDCISGVPIAGFITKVFKAIKNFGDYNMANKLVNFLIETENMDDKKIDKFLKKNVIGKEQNVGMRIIEILNRLNQNEKATLIGKLYRYIVENELDIVVFFKVSHLIDATFYDDLKGILAFRDNKQLTTNNKFIDTETIESLFQNGFLTDCGFRGGTWNANEDEDSGTSFCLNKYGEILIRIV